MFSVRWSIVRLIWFREMREQLRDRRTMSMSLLLPLLIYPLAAVGLMQLATGVATEQHTIGIVGAHHLPEKSPRAHGADFVRAASLIASATDPVSGWNLYRAQKRLQAFPSFLVRNKNKLRAAPQYLTIPEEALTMRFKRLSRKNAMKALEDRKVDVILIVPPNFHTALLQARPGKQPVLAIRSIPGDDTSARAARRLFALLLRWQRDVKETQFARQSLPTTFDVPFYILDSELQKSIETQATDDLYELFIRIFPIILVMWSLAGALYPAVDLCAGEKERGTMETLLISPAQREEIVLGKFFAIWVFSGATALLNLLSMSVTAWQFSGALGQAPIQGMGVVWCVVLILPLSAFFSAICLAIGAYARSTKEGQYYLMPLFLVTMPLVMVTMAPGVKLSPLTSLIPVTGVSLLLHKLLTTDTLANVPWLFFVPVLVPMVAYSLGALRWAV